jgi:predicted dehydrogenase
MNTKKIGIGFFGAGDVSILHGEAIRLNNRAKLIGIWNRTELRGKERAKQFGCKYYSDPLHLLDDHEIDAVFILTNVETHLKYAKLALKKRKHVFIEKPVGVSLSEVKEIKDISEKTGVICMPGHNMIYEQGILRIKNLIEKGNLGKIVSVYVLYNIHHSEEVASHYPGVMRQILTHNLYCMLYLAGKPASVISMKSCLHYKDLKREDIAMAILELESGALAHLSASFAADDLCSDPWTFLIKVIGTEGTARYTYQDWVLAKKGLAHSRVYEAYQGTITNEVNHFINICCNGGTPLSTLDDAIDAQKIMEAAELSIKNRKIINI